MLCRRRVAAGGVASSLLFLLQLRVTSALTLLRSTRGTQRLVDDAQRNRDAASAAAAKKEQKQLNKLLSDAQSELRDIKSSWTQRYADITAEELEAQEGIYDALVQYTLSLSAGKLWLAISFLPRMVLSDSALRAVAREQQRRA